MMGNVFILIWDEPQFQLTIKSSFCSHKCLVLNPLWPGDTIWQHRTGSTLVQVMACCLMAPCWLIIIEVTWHSCKGTICKIPENTNQQNRTENFYTLLKLHPDLPGANVLIYSFSGQSAPTRQKEVTFWVEPSISSKSDADFILGLWRELWDAIIYPCLRYLTPRSSYGSGHEGAAVLLPGFAIKW